MTFRTPRLAAIVMACAMVAVCAVAALAEDGVIEINQAKINASGFPIFSISSSGSYKLTSNITVTTSATEAISIGAPQVTLDLNGFTISGSGIATADIFAQSGSTQFVLKNGTIVGNASTDCLQLANTDTSTIDHLTFSGCVGGIAIGANSRITNSTLNLPSGANAGINCTGSSCMVENTVINAPNGSFLLFFHDSTSLYGGNVINAGSGGSFIVDGGTSQGNNACTSGGSTTKC